MLLIQSEEKLYEWFQKFILQETKQHTEVELIPWGD